MSNLADDFIADVVANGFDGDMAGRITDAVDTLCSEIRELFNAVMDQHNIQQARIERYINDIHDHLTRAHIAAQLLGKSWIDQITLTPIPDCPCHSCTTDAITGEPT
jgi:hypothetical protein